MIPVLKIVVIVTDAFLTVLRKTRLLALLRALAYPFVVLHNRLHDEHEAYAIDYLNWNSQICRLEGLLNSKYNPPGSGVWITIGEGLRYHQYYLHYERRNLPLYMYKSSNPLSADWFYTHKANVFGNGGYDFTVNIPSVLIPGMSDPRIDQIKQLLKRYKLAGKQYKIKFT